MEGKFSIIPEFLPNQRGKSIYMIIENLQNIN